MIIKIEGIIRWDTLNRRARAVRRLLGVMMRLRRRRRKVAVPTRRVRVGRLVCRCDPLDRCGL